MGLPTVAGSARPRSKAANLAKLELVGHQESTLVNLRRWLDLAVGRWFKAANWSRHTGLAPQDTEQLFALAPAQSGGAWCKKVRSGREKVQKGRHQGYDIQSRTVSWPAHDAGA